MILYHVTVYNDDNTPDLEPINCVAKDNVIPELFTSTSENVFVTNSVPEMLGHLARSEYTVLKILDFSSSVQVKDHKNLQLNIEVKTTRVLDPNQTKHLLKKLLVTIGISCRDSLKLPPVVKCYLTDDSDNEVLRNFAYECVCKGPSSAADLLDDNSWVILQDILRPDVHNGLKNVLTFFRKFKTIQDTYDSALDYWFNYLVKQLN